MTTEPTAQRGTDHPQPLDGSDLDECMPHLLDPLSDLVSSIKYSGAKLITMLLRHEYQRGFAAGQLAAQQTPEHVIATGDGTPLGYVVKTRGDDSGRVMISPPGGLDAGQAR